MRINQLFHTSVSYNANDSAKNISVSINHIPGESITLIIKFYRKRYLTKFDRTKKSSHRQISSIIQTGISRFKMPQSIT